MLKFPITIDYPMKIINYFKCYYSVKVINRALYERIKQLTLQNEVENQNQQLNVWLLSTWVLREN